MTQLKTELFIKNKQNLSEISLYLEKHTNRTTILKAVSLIFKYKIQLYKSSVCMHNSCILFLITLGHCNQIELNFPLKYVKANKMRGILSLGAL